MASENLKQAQKAILRAKRTLILAQNPNDIDVIAAISALLSFLKKQGLVTEAVLPGFTAEKAPACLSQVEQIRTTMGGLRNLRIRVNVKETPLEELSYNIQDDELHIFLTPKKGEWQKKHVGIHPEEDKYDLILTLGCADRSELISLFQPYQDLLFRIPNINLDHQTENEQWGTLNVVDITAASLTEIIFNWLHQWSEEKISPEIATALLTGITAKTNGFRNKNLHPKTLQTAATLIGMGAERERIVHELWRTRKTETLKLWGRALSRLEQDTKNGIAWTWISQQDLLETGTKDGRLEEMVQELIAYTPETEMTLLFCEKDPHTTKVVLFTRSPYDANDIGMKAGLSGTKNRAIGAVAKGIPEAKTEILDIIRDQIKKQDKR